MKKLVSVLLVFVMMLSMAVPAFAAAEAKVTLAADKTKIAAGESVELTLSIDKAMSEVGTFELRVYYDTEKYDLTGSVAGKNCGTTIPAISKKPIADKSGNLYYKVAAFDALNGYFDITAGTIATLTFTAKEDIVGTADTTFTLNVFTFKNKVSQAREVEGSAPISVTVEGAHVHSWTKVKDAQDATCKEAGNIEYYTCSCGKYAKLVGTDYVVIALADTVIPKTNNHTLKHVDAVVSTNCGQDNVAEHWVCTVCGKLFSDDAGKNETTLDKLTTKKAHTLEKVEAVAATCTTDGKEAHYKCKDCGRLFTDAAGKNETTADKLVIPAAHKLVKTGAIDATCTTIGNIAYWQCTECEKYFSDAAGKTEIELADATIAALGHELTKTEKVDSTCTATGCEAYWTCSRCKGIFADEQGTKATTLKDLTIEKKAHTPSEFYVITTTEHYKTCSDCGTEIKDSRAKHTFVKNETTGVETCSVCGQAIGGKVDENHQHAAGNDWFRDENNHWHKCTDPKCTAHVDEAKHDFETVSTTKDGNKTTTVEKCKTCEYVKTTTVDNTPTTPTKPGRRPSDRNKTVESGKTFDAGVGVYVGLSILSLTGSAVVIGKKRKTR